jgi:hypothetical protein
MITQKNKIYMAQASASASYTGQNGETIIGTATATATSYKSYNEAYIRAKKIAEQIALQNATHAANIIDESVSISKTVTNGSTGNGGNSVSPYNGDLMRYLLRPIA